MIVSTEAVILKSINYLESSKIIYAYTKDYGRQTLIAKGARKSKSKFGSALETTSLVSLIYYKKSNRDMQILSEAEYLKNFSKIRSKLECTCAVFMICESLLLTEKEENPHPEYFDQLKDILELLDRSGNYRSAFIRSQILLADTIGHGIHLTWKDSSEVEYDPDREVFVRLDDCKISKSSSKLLRNSIKLPISVLLAFKELKTEKELDIDKKSFRKAVDFFEDYFSLHLEKNFEYRAYKMLPEVSRGFTTS